MKKIISFFAIFSFMLMSSCSIIKEITTFQDIEDSSKATISYDATDDGLMQIVTPGILYSYLIKLIHTTFLMAIMHQKPFSWKALKNLY